MSAILGIEKLLRPAWNFELDYDGVSGKFPIFFTWPPASTRPALGATDYSILDEEARLSQVPTGISPTLAKFVSVPAGASMLVQFPFVPRTADQEREWVYVWRIVWRTRSAANFVNNKKRRKPYQIGKTTFGAPDSRTAQVPDPRGITSVGGQRYVIPGSSEAAIYGRGEPNPFEMGAGPVSSYFLQDSVAISVSPKVLTASPLYPGQVNYGGGGYIRYMDYQQGVFDPDFPGITESEDPTFNFNTLTATHLSKWIKSQGTEFAVECYKFSYIDPNNVQTYTPLDWNFGIGNVEPNLPDPASEDYAFSVMFGIGALVNTVGREPPIDTGVRVMTGSAPQ